MRTYTRGVSLPVCLPLLLMGEGFALIPHVSNRTLGIALGALGAVGGATAAGIAIERHFAPQPLPTVSFDDSATQNKPENPNATDWMDHALRTNTHVIVAHRGDTEGGDGNAPAKPNTLGSLDAAANDHATDAIEMDISTLGDGTLVVYHPGDDKTIHNLKSLTAADLPEHPQISTLKQWATRAGQDGINVLAEFKNLSLPKESAATTNARVGAALSTLEQHITPQHLVTYSFVASELRTIHAIDPTIPTGLITRPIPTTLGQELQVHSLGYKPTFIYMFEHAPSSLDLAAFRAQGIGVMAAGGSAAHERYMFSQNDVPGFITGTPVEARAAVTQ